MKKRLGTIFNNHLTTFLKVVVGLMICMLISIESGYAQEVDKSHSNKKKLRETKFKTKNKQGDRIHKGDITGRKNKRIKKSKKRNKVTTPSSTPYSSPYYGGTDRRKEGKQVQKSDGFFNTPSRSTENHRKGDISGRKSRKSVMRTGGSKAVRSSVNPYAGRKNQSEGQRAKKSRAQAGGFQSISQSGEDKPKKRKRIQPRSASRAFVARKKVNAYAGRARRGERAKTKDIAGRKIRSKNFKSRSQPIIRPSFHPYFARKSKGDQAKTAIKGTGYASISKKGERKYKGQAAGGHASATKKGENAWRKDITGRNFKGPKDPGVVTGKKGVNFTGTLGRRLSISGGAKNNSGRSVNTSGSGGSISGQAKGGRRSVLPRRNLSTPQTGGFAGNIKRNGKPLKGGGSISRSNWNNNRQALPRKNKPQNSFSQFQGNLNINGKPLKGGGSISRSSWNNNRQALPRKNKPQNSFSQFQGNLNINGKPLKGGGSISRSSWNNNGNPLIHKHTQNKNIAEFKGRFNRFALSPGHLSKDIARYRGAWKMKIKYRKNPDAHKDALKGIAPKAGAFTKAMAFQGHFKIKKNYNRNMHPSAKYTTSQRPINSLEKKDKTFKFTIWWAKLFKKNANQPTVVKEKIQNPRYDKREKNLWYD